MKQVTKNLHEPSQTMPMEIVGNKKKLEDCGKVWKIEPGHKIKYKHCMRRECPICYNAWRAREAGRQYNLLKKAFGQLTRKFGTKKEAHRSIGAIRHYVFSPPQEWAKDRLKSESSYRYMRSELNEILREHGMRASVIVFNPWRTTDLADRMFKRAQENGVECGEWEWLRTIGLGHINDGEYIHLSPFFHVIGYGFITQPNQFYKQTVKRGREGEGWIYKNIRNLYTKGSIFATIWYVLGHTAIMGEQKTVKSITKNGFVYEKKQYLLNSITQVGEFPGKRKQQKKKRRNKQ